MLFNWYRRVMFHRVIFSKTPTSRVMERWRIGKSYKSFALMSIYKLVCLHFLEAQFELSNTRDSRWSKTRSRKMKKRSTSAWWGNKNPKYDSFNWETLRVFFDLERAGKEILLAVFFSDTKKWNWQKLEVEIYLFLTMIAISVRRRKRFPKQ